MVYTTALRLLGQEAEAEDAAQKAFLKAFERRAELKGMENPGGWLRTVTKNLCLNHLERHRKRWRSFTELEEETLSEPAPAARSESLEQAVLELPDHQRVPLVLFHFNDMSYEDIARSTGASLAKVKTDIFRGREALRRILGEDFA